MTNKMMKAPAVAADSPVTRLLKQWTSGDKSALDEAMPLIYSQLRKMARNQMKGENPGHTLSTTSLINELYLELVDRQRLEFENRYQFFAFSAKIMRHLLVRHARQRRASKRGGGRILEALHESVVLENGRHLDREEMVALGEAMDRLERLDVRQMRVVELRYFAGLTQEEIGEALELSLSTVKREIRTAQLWLSRCLVQKTPALARKL